MIIVSQDKTSITNFDNINTLRATKAGGIMSFDNSYRAPEDCSDILGRYKTEERAKEVLQEIVNKYRQYNLDNDKSVTLLPKVYEMPKE